MDGDPIEIRGDRYIQRAEPAPEAAQDLMLYLRGTIRAGRLLVERSLRPTPYEEARRWLDGLHG